jgi:UDP-glucose 4-epimerase
MVDIVTGGAGFIGSHLVDKLLSMGRRVRVIDIKHDTPNIKQHEDNPKLVHHRIDIGFDYFDDLFDGAEDVYHLAALADIVPSIREPEIYFRTNVTGTMKVMEAARKAGAQRVIYAASSSCYGDKVQIPTPESYDIHSARKYPYALTKYLGEQIVMHWSKVYAIPAISLRLFNVYGPRSRTNGAYGAVFGVFLAQLLAGKPLTIVGDGHQQRDFIFVSDVVDAFLAAAQSDGIEKIYNVGSGSPESVNYIARLLGGKNYIHIPKRPGEPDITHADISRIKADLAWHPKVNIETGIQIMLDNIDYWRDAPVWTPDSIAYETKEWFSCLGRQNFE